MPADADLPTPATPLVQVQMRRLAELRLLEPLDPMAQQPFIGTLKLAALGMGVSGAMLVLVEGEHCRVLVQHGLVLSHYPLDGSIVQATVRGNAPLVVHDLTAGAQAGPLPAEARAAAVRFIAAVPVTGLDGEPIGAACLMDAAPIAPLSPAQQAMLGSLGGVITGALRHRQRRMALQAERELLSDGPCATVVWQALPGWPLGYRSRNLGQVLGRQAERRLSAGAAFDQLLHPQDRALLRSALDSHVQTGLARLALSYRVLDLDGRARWIRHTSVARADAQGQVRQVQGYLLDETRQRETEALTAQVQDSLHLALEAARLGTWSLDIPAGERRSSLQVAEMLGLRSEELGNLSQRWLDRVHPFDRAVADSTYCINNHGADTLSYAYRVRHRAGHHVWLQAHAHITRRDETGQATHLVGVLKDISAEKQAQQLQQRQARLLDLLNRAQRDFLLGQDISTVCQGLLPPLLALAEARFGAVGLLQPAAQAQAPALHLLAVRQAGARPAGPAAVPLHSLGEPLRTVLEAATPLLSAQPELAWLGPHWPAGVTALDNLLALPIQAEGQVLGLLALGHSEEPLADALPALLAPLLATLGTLVQAGRLAQARQHAEQQLAAQRLADPLTGVATLASFMVQLQAALLRAQAGGEAVCLAVLDLDHFHRINQAVGHAAGDVVVGRVAALARALLRQGDGLGRLGGAEFCLLLPGLDADEAEPLLQGLRLALASARLDADGQQIVRLTGSLGLAQAHAGLADARAWMAAAVQACQQAKAQGRNQLAVHRPADEPAAVPALQPPSPSP